MACSCSNKTLVRRQVDSLTKYFTMLSRTGYDKDASWKRLLLLSFITDWVESDLNFFLTDADYEVLNKILLSISGDCLIPYAGFCQNRLVMGSPTFMGGYAVRITEEDQGRFTETDTGNQHRITEPETK